MIQSRRKYEHGGVNEWLIATIALGVMTLILIGVSIWLYINYDDQKTNVDSKVQAAVTEAKKAEGDKLEAEFTEREKKPYREFVGPEDYGLVTFDYPKTWSVYILRDASNGGTFEAYLNPISIPPISASQQLALRVWIESIDFDRLLQSYSNAVQKGELRTSSISVNGNEGTRLDGTFSKDIRGAAVLFKIRDKTLTIRTDAETFIKSKDFDNVVNSIKINK